MSSFKTVFAATFIGLTIGVGGVYFFLMDDQQRLVAQASLGSTAAQSALAENYFLGKDGFKINPEKQRYWLERAAVADVGAKMRLGMVLAFSDREADVVRGRELMLDALKTTPPESQKDAMFMLALSHALVQPLNPQRGAGWYQRALSAGSEEALQAMFDLFTLEDGKAREDAVSLQAVKARLEQAKTKVEGSFYTTP